MEKILSRLHIATGYILKVHLVSSCFEIWKQFQQVEDGLPVCHLYPNIANFELRDPKINELKL